MDSFAVRGIALDVDSRHFGMFTAGDSVACRIYSRGKLVVRIGIRETRNISPISFGLVRDGRFMMFRLQTLQTVHTYRPTERDNGKHFQTPRIYGRFPCASSSASICTTHV